MKSLYLTILFLAIFSCSYAQWTTNGNDISNTNLGNVGIGTATPVSLLDVSGNVSMIANSGLFFNSYWSGNWKYRANGYGNIMYQSGTGDFVFATMGNNTGGTGSIAIPNTRMTILNNGNVGIGTTTPGAALTVTSPTPLIQLFDSDFNPADGSSLGKLAFGSMTEFASIEGIRTSGQLDDVTQIRFSTSFATGAGGDGNNIERMRLTYQGNLLINKTSQTNPSYKLDVNGNVRANQITVNTNGADFVFASKYKLTPLVAIKKYIDQNHHLPEIASAREMQTEGLNVGENQTKLLQKVEELTLYLIEKDQKATDQEAKLKKQQEKIVSQEKRISKLEKALEQILQDNHNKN